MVSARLESVMQNRDDDARISKSGKPAAALADAAPLTGARRRMRKRLDALGGRLAGAYAQTPIEQGQAEIDAAVAAGRGQRQLAG